MSSSLQNNPRQPLKTFDRFGADEQSTEGSLQWVCSIAGQLGDAFMVFARWQCLGLGGEFWKKDADGQLLRPGDDEWLAYFHPDDQGVVALGLADPSVNTFPSVRILSLDGGTYQRASLRMFYPPFETEEHLFAIVLVKESSGEAKAEEPAPSSEPEQMLASSTAEVIEMVRSSGVILNLSISFEEANHLEEDEATDREWSSLALMEEAYAAMLMEKIKQHAELRNYPAVIRSRDGRAREMLIDVLPSLEDEDNVVLTFKDVTSHNHACRHLHEVIDRLPFGVFTRGFENGKYQLSNTKANKLLNNCAPLRGLEDGDLFSENDVARILSNLNLNSESGVLNSCEPLRLDDGSMEIRYLPMRDSNGQVTRVVGIVQTIDELSPEVEGELGLNTESLLNVGHEIRTPMNAILGFTALLADTALHAEQMEMLETVRASGEALSNTVDLMLDLAALNGSGNALQADVMNIEALLEDLGGAYSESAAEQGLLLSVEVDPRIPSGLEADAPKLRQLLENLVKNALKFTQKGEVGIQADLIERVGDEAFIQLSVFDTGIGISLEKQKLIFEAFQQADSTESRSYEGTGLGLTVSDRIAQVMGSRIELQSAPGEGSVFSLKLTLKVSIASALGDEQACPNGLSVLILSDEKERGEALARMLSVWGAETKVTASVEEFCHANKSPEGHHIGICVLSRGAELAPAIGPLVENGKALLLLSDSETVALWEEAYGSDRILPSIHRGSLVRTCLKAFMEASTENMAQPEGLSSVPGRLTGLSVLLVDDRSDERGAMVSILSKWGVEVDICESEHTAIEFVLSKGYDFIFFEANFLGVDTARMVQGLRLQLIDESRTIFVGLARPNMNSTAPNLSAAQVEQSLSKPVNATKLRALLEGQA